MPKRAHSHHSELHRAAEKLLARAVKLQELSEAFMSASTQVSDFVTKFGAVQADEATTISQITQNLDAALAGGNLDPTVQASLDAILATETTQRDALAAIAAKVAPKS